MPEPANVSAWPLACHYGPRREQRIAHRDSAEWRALLEPGLRRRMAPQRLALWIVERPADRFVIGIDGEIVGGEQLDAVVVGIAYVKKECVRDAVPAWAAFHVGQIA